jgi:protocatechuate 3,4-dioxygenase beta subunit
MWYGSQISKLHIKHVGETMMKQRSSICTYGKILLMMALVYSVMIMGFSPLQADDKSDPEECQPTPADALGPFYKPDAPIRSKVGEGYVLQGVVRSTQDCQPISEAVIEFWMAGPDGQYTDDYRAQVIADEEGYYTFESPVPTVYTSRPPHIHIRVTADDHQVLVTQHYSEKDQNTADFDLVLQPL